MRRSGLVAARVPRGDGKQSGFGVVLPDRLPDGRFAESAAEDHLIEGQALRCWLANDMGPARARELERIDAAIVAGSLMLWEQVSDFILPPVGNYIVREEEEIHDGQHHAT